VRVDDREGIALLRETLIRGEYTSDGFKRVLGGEPDIQLEGGVPTALRRLPEGDPTTTLFKLFHLGLAVDADEAAAALAPLELDRLAGMGLMAVHEAQVEPLVGISRIAGLLIASDRFSEHPEHHDYVAPVAPGTLLLAAVTVRERIDACLDIGAGSGFQALLAAAHARRVVAVDINPRALRYAELNALLNDRPNVEVRVGSLFEPVEGETFDLIVSNPPYVISPDSEYAFRDSGLPGDSFVEGLVRTIPSYLREGGFAHVLAEWVIAPDEDWPSAPRRWVEDSGCDAVIFQLTRQRPLDYAALWNRQLRDEPEAFGAALDRWVEHFEQLGIEHVGWGGIFLRRRSDANWIWTHDGREPKTFDPAEHHVRRMFAAQDFLTGRNEQALLDARLALADDARLHVEFTVKEGKRLVRSAGLSLASGLHARVDLDKRPLELVSRLDEGRPLREILAEMAPDDVDLESFETASARAVRRLVELGFIVPATTKPQRASSGGRRGTARRRLRR
jgi:SAM-dependent methyltransferase